MHPQNSHVEILTLSAAVFKALIGALTLFISTHGCPKVCTHTDPRTQTHTHRPTLGSPSGWSAPSSRIRSVTSHAWALGLGVGIDLKHPSFPDLPVHSLLTWQVQFKPHIPQRLVFHPFKQNSFPTNSRSQRLLPILPSRGDDYDSVILMRSWGTGPLSCEFSCVPHNILTGLLDAEGT